MLRIILEQAVNAIEFKIRRAIENWKFVFTILATICMTYVVAVMLLLSVVAVWLGVIMPNVWLFAIGILGFWLTKNALVLIQHALDILIRMAADILQAAVPIAVASFCLVMMKHLQLISMEQLYWFKSAFGVFLPPILSEAMAGNVLFLLDIVVILIIAFSYSCSN